jgi:hypothetical protein
MSLFQAIFTKVLNEDIGMTSGGAGGVFGGGETGGSFPGGGDTYASGDARIPDLLGSKKANKSKKRRKKRKRKSKSKKVKKEEIHIQRRNLKNTL